jgi:hypothetical protein
MVVRKQNKNGVEFWLKGHSNQVVVKFKLVKAGIAHRCWFKQVVVIHLYVLRR